MNGISIKLDDKNYVFLLKFYLNDNDDDLLNYFNDFAAAALGTMRMRLVHERQQNSMNQSITLRNFFFIFQIIRLISA